MTIPDPSDAVGEAAPGKINLSLCVGERCSDGRHHLASLVVFADVGDRLTAAPGAEPGVALHVSGPFAENVPSGGENLVLRAARLFAESVNIPDAAAALSLSLVKNLPVAAGLGGGSADAAATLRALSRLWKQPDTDLRPVAEKLGADVPVCLGSRAAWMTGIGETIRPLALPELPAVLVHPGVALQTGDVFAALSRDDAADGRESIHDAPPPELKTPSGVADWCRSRRNTLQEPAAALAPVIPDVLGVLEKIPGCRLARMSGSGASCFALFDSPADAAAAAKNVSRARPAWWVREAILNRDAQC